MFAFRAGEFADDAPVNAGTWQFASGDMYVGEVSASKFHGQGKLTTAAGLVYEGQFAEGMRHGVGKLEYPNGNVYEVN